jgi:UDP-3-O-[3-hydroxymyristoyl] glucosamine N-acyltransferase
MNILNQFGNKKKAIIMASPYNCCIFVVQQNYSMRFSKPVSVKWLADYVGATIIGSDNLEALGINEIHRVENGDITFVDLEKYYAKVLGSAASIILIDKETTCPPGKVLLQTADPCGAFIKLCAHFRPFVPATAQISATATIGEGTIIQPGVFIGNNVSIGTNCIIHANVSIYDDSIIGNNVIINSNTVIGGDAFYFKKRPGNAQLYDKMHSCGRAIIHDNVEIGSNCSIDRGVSGDTTIGAGTKLDNQIHIGHDTIIGKNCLFAAQVGVAGAVNIEDGVVLYGQVGVSKDLTIGANTVVFAKSGVPKSLPPNGVFFGIPVQEAKEKMEELVWVKRIPELWEKLNKQ